MLTNDYNLTKLRFIYCEHYNIIVNMPCNSMAFKRLKMKTYKVIKEFGSAQKGDLLNENEEGLFELFVECNCDDCYSSRSVCISSDVADTLALAGYLEELETEKECAEEVKLRELSEHIDQLLTQYEIDHNSLIDQYNEGDVPQCVKVEADTVYYNMTKVLKHIQELINE